MPSAGHLYGRASIFDSILEDDNVDKVSACDLCSVYSDFSSRPFVFRFLSLRIGKKLTRV